MLKRIKPDNNHFSGDEAGAEIRTRVGGSTVP